MKYFYPLLVLFVLVVISNCSDEAQNSIEGFWVSLDYPGSDSIFSPTVLKFGEDGYLYQPYFIFKYQVSNKKIRYKRGEFMNGSFYEAEGEEEAVVEYVICNDTLYIYMNNTDTLTHKSVRLKDKHFSEYLIRNSELEIDLPVYEKSNEEKIYYLNAAMNCNIFLSERNDTCFVSYGGKIQPLDRSFFHELSFYYEASHPIDIPKERIMLFIDKNVNMEFIHTLYYNFQVMGIHRFKFILSNNNPDYYSYFSKRIPPLTDYENADRLLADSLYFSIPKPEPDPRKYYSLKNRMLVEVLSDSVFIDGEYFKDYEYYDFEVKIRKNMGNYPGVYLFVSDNSTVETYLKINIILRNALINVRDEKALEIFGENFSNLEARKKDKIVSKYKFFVSEIDREELETVLFLDF